MDEDSERDITREAEWEDFMAKREELKTLQAVLDSLDNELAEQDASDIREKERIKKQDMYFVDFP